jgi:anti-sigma factor RsiW
MNCTEVLALAPQFHTGELLSAEAREVSTHLQSCPTCSLELAQQQAFDWLLREGVLADPVDSSRVDCNVRKMVAAESRVPLSRWSPMSRPGWTLGAAAAVAAVLLLTIFLLRTTPVYAAAARDHRVEIVDGQPRKWLTDREALANLASVQTVPEFIAGYHLQRGRLCRLNGQIFLHLVYENNSRSVSVFIRRADGAETIHMESQGAQHVAGFRKDGLNALIVTEQPYAAALRFAHATAALL